MENKKAPIKNLNRKEFNPTMLSQSLKNQKIDQV